MSINVSLGRFGKTERTCVRIGSANVLITVILPTYDNSLWIHEWLFGLVLGLVVASTTYLIVDYFGITPKNLKSWVLNSTSVAQIRLLTISIQYFV
jgi:hypothetical protein